MKGMDELSKIVFVSLLPTGLYIYIKYDTFAEIYTNQVEVVKFLMLFVAFLYLLIVSYKLFKHKSPQLGILEDYKIHLLLGVLWLTFTTALDILHKIF